MDIPCVHSCKGLCKALEVAEHREEEALKEYRGYLANCDYPDVREILRELIAEREKALRILREKKDVLTGKFNIIDGINESYL
jgi:rubrerythrin